MEEKSKSQKKREATAIQQLGVKLSQLNDSTLQQLPLAPHVYQAIVELKRIKSHGALRRQAQLIGKLMRQEDYEAITEAYQKILDEQSAVTATFHEIERWRTRLIEEGNVALTEFIACYQPADIVHLRQLIKKAQEELSMTEPKGASKALFRYLRETIL